MLSICLIPFVGVGLPIRNIPLGQLGAAPDVVCTPVLICFFQGYQKHFCVIFLFDF